MKPKAALVDLYGTVLVRPHHANPIKELIKALGFTEGRYQRAYEIVSTRPDVESASDVVRLLAPHRMDDIDIAKYDRLLEDAISGTTVVPEAKAVLGELKERGILLGAVSNTAAPLKRPFYDHGIDQYMATAVFSCDARYRKPHDMIYRIAFDKLQKAAERRAMPSIDSKTNSAYSAASTSFAQDMVLSPDIPYMQSHITRLTVQPLRREEVVVFGDSHLKDYVASRQNALPAMVIDRSKGMDLYTMLDVFCNGNVPADAAQFPDLLSARISLR